MSTRQLKRKWTPHAGQRTVLADDHRYRTIACGRRWGKSEMCVNLVVEWAWDNDGANIWWVAPTYQDAYDFGWGDDAAARGVYDALPETVIRSKRRKDPRRIELINGSVITFRSADNPDSLRGSGLSLLVIDEAAIIPDHTWQEELRPTLMDEAAPMVAIGTPKGPNWFKTMWARGQDPKDDVVNSWNAPTYENPYIDDAEIEAARHDMPELKFRQEILAEFVEESGGVFVGVRDCLREYDMDADSPPTDTFESPYTLGVDLGRAENFSVVTALDANGKLAGYRRLRQTSWSVIQAAIEAVAERRRPCTVRIDATRDNSFIEDIERKGFRVEPVKATYQTKREMVDNLAVKIEKGEIVLPGTESPTGRLEPDIPELINELEIFEYDTTPKGRVTYGAPAGSHDDCVDSLAMAAKGPARTAGTW